MVKPRYLKLLKSGELKSRADILNKRLESCNICPHKCKVNRLEGEKGYCNTPRQAVVSAYQPHFGEERELVGQGGSGTIFFSNCNLECVFCQNYQISQQGRGKEVSADELSRMMLYLQRLGCHNINLVSPSHVVPQIVEGIYLAAKEGLNIPIVYNTNGYDLVETLALLEGIVDIYMPDIKFSDDDVAYEYLGVEGYFSFAKRAIKEMYRQVGNLKLDEAGTAYTGLLIRHLVMPNNLAGTEKIMDFIAREISKDAHVNIMAQYYPANRAYDYEHLDRRLNRREYKEAIEAARYAGLRNFR